MFPWLMPNATMGGNLSLLSMMYSNPPSQGGFFGAPSAQNIWPNFYPQPQRDRADQTPQGNQPDTGNAMAPGQQPPGGPDDNPQRGYDSNTVSPGWGAPSWMRVASGMQRATGNQRSNPYAMGMLGLSMMQPRQPNIPRPYPWI